MTNLVKTALIAVASLAGPSQASITPLPPTASLTWTSAGSNLDYQVYFSTCSHSYPFKVDVGTNCAVTIAGLELYRTYYFSVTATDTNGVEGDFAPEVPIFVLQSYQLHFDVQGQLQSSTNLINWKPRAGTAVGGGWQVSANPKVPKEFYRTASTNTTQ